MHSSPAAARTTRWLSPLALGLAVALATSGCLGSTYRVPLEDAMQLTQAPPGTRGQTVRVVQRWSTSSDPSTDSGGGGGGPVRVGYGVYVSSDGSRSRGRSGGSDSRGGGSSSSSGSGGSSASDAAAAALAVVVLAAGAMVIVGATEGARYDGWVRVPETTPVYLLGPDGGRLRVPLAELRPEHVAWADEVVLVEDGTWAELGRAPLDRRGFTYGLDLGSGGLIARDGRTPWGFLGRLSFGGFPINELGFFGTVTFGWAALDGNTVFHARYGFEVDTYPLVAGPLHAGLHAEVGDEHRLEDLDSGGTLGDHGLFWGAGPLLQLELTTRLALTLRGSLVGVDVEDHMTLTGDVSVGLAAY